MKCCVQRTSPNQCLRWIERSSEEGVLPHGFNVGHCTIAGNVAPGLQFVRPRVTQHVTYLRPSVKLQQSRDWACLESDVIRIEEHGGKPPEDRGQTAFKRHVSGISWGIEWNRLFIQDIRKPVKFVLEVLDGAVERRRSFDLLRDESLSPLVSRDLSIRMNWDLHHPQDDRTIWLLHGYRRFY